VKIAANDAWELSFNVAAALCQPNKFSDIIHTNLRVIVNYQLFQIWQLCQSQ